MSSLESRLWLESLFDTYGALLTARQQDVFKLHLHHDLSLGEVAEQLGISRPAVADHLRRAEEFLTRCESSLGLSSRLSDMDMRFQLIHGLLINVRADWPGSDVPPKLLEAIEIVSEQCETESHHSECPT